MHFYYDSLAFKLFEINQLNTFIYYSELEALSFLGLTNVNYLSLCDNTIPAMPKHIFAHMPKVKTLDLGRIKLQNLPEDSFKVCGKLSSISLFLIIRYCVYIFS